MLAVLISMAVLGPIQVACVGDSITQGRGGMNSYPAQLQKILGDRYIVENYGRQSASVLPGTLQYRRLPECESALKSQPNVVLVMLGTNDSPGPNWTARRPAFTETYRSLVREFMGLPTKPKVVIMMPPPMFFSEADWRPKNLDEQIIPALGEVAKELKLATFDARALFDGKGDVFTDRLHPNNLGFRVLAEAVAKDVFDTPKREAKLKRLDWAKDAKRQVVVDREEGQYLGHVSTTLLPDSKTILAVYPKGHGKGAIVMKRSTDGGKTWSDRLPTPENWATSLETPTLTRIDDKRIILWSGLYPARLAVSDDLGATWSPLKQAGDWGGIVVMGDVKPLKDGRWLALFHDDGRFFKQGGKLVPTMTLYETFSADNGLTWSTPEAIFASSDVHLCEPGMIRSDDGRQLAVLLRENKRVKPSHVMFTNDEAKTWSTPRPMNEALTGDRHTLKRLADGRLVCVFRDMQDGPWKGDFVAWVGSYEDLVMGKPGQMKIRLLDNQDSWDCGYPGLEILPDGTVVATTYGHWDKDKPAYIKSVRFNAQELK